MSERDDERAIRHILVALDASADSAAALEAAAGLAALLGAELHGLHVEDVNLLRLPGLSLTTEIDLLTGEPRPLAAEMLERHLRRRAERARRALEQVGRRTRVRWTFRTARGRVAAELLAAEADLVTLGVRGHSLRRGPGSTARELLEGARAPVLLLRRGARLGRTVHAVHDGSPAARRAVRVATDLARRQGAPLTVLAGSGEGARKDIEEIVAGDEGRRGPEIHLAPLPDGPAELAAAVRRQGCGLLVLPRAGEAAPPGALPDLVRRAHCPVLVVG